MIDFSIARLDKLAIHRVGNKLRDEGIHFSKSLVNQVDEHVNTLLGTYFFSPFKSQELYNFVHSSNLELNEAYKFCSSFFEGDNDFLSISIAFAKHLYDVSNHPKINGGEIYLVHITDCVIEDEVVDAIGIFKSESKDTFLKVFPEGNSFTINEDSGININRLDKGAIVFKSEKDNGYKVSIVDIVNQGKEAVYWKSNFLGLDVRDDNHSRTKGLISLCREFISDSVKDNSMDKKSGIDLITKSHKYLSDNEHYNESDFIETLQFNDSQIRSFESFKHAKSEKGKDIPIEFKIVKKVVKDKKRFLTPFIQLDNNFKLQVIGSSDNLEKGYDDERRLHYYKLFYFDEK